MKLQYSKGKGGVHRNQPPVSNQKTRAVERRGFTDVVHHKCQKRGYLVGTRGDKAAQKVLDTRQTNGQEELYAHMLYNLDDEGWMKRI